MDSSCDTTVKRFGRLMHGGAEGGRSSVEPEHIILTTEEEFEKYQEVLRDNRTRVQARDSSLIACLCSYRMFKSVCEFSRGLIGRASVCLFLLPICPMNMQRENCRRFQIEMDRRGSVWNHLQSARTTEASACRLGTVQYLSRSSSFAFPVRSWNPCFS